MKPREKKIKKRKEKGNKRKVWLLLRASVYLRRS